MAKKERIMIETYDIDNKWFQFNEKDCTFSIREDAPDEVKELYEKNKQLKKEMDDYIFRDFKRKKNVKF